MNKIQGLLNWCKHHTDGYPNVSITNFTISWRNGLAFSALIHRFKPELIDFHRLDPDNEYYNNYMAFKLAETHFGIPSLLDPKDMILPSSPEKLSIITYVSQFYNCLKEMEPMGGPTVNMFANTNNLNSDYESMSSRSSLCKLAEMKCSMCRNKVYILERYVAEDKLFHRKCYRDYQIQNIDNDSEVIGDYLNIYGELKPSMNKDIFVHPLQGFKTGEQVDSLITNPPCRVSVEILSDSDISGQDDEESESLSSFSSDASEQCTYENLASTKDSVASKNIGRITDVSDNTDFAISCQENLVLNIVKATSLKPIKTRLYVKKRNKELPYSTFFEVPDNTHSKSYLNCVDNDLEETCTEEKLISNIKQSDIDDKNEEETATVSSDHRKLIVLNPDEDSESDLSSSEEEQTEALQPSIVRNSIWRKPIICSTSVRKYHSVSVPIETKYKCYSEFKDRLADLNMKQSQIEIKGRKIQHRLWEEDPTTPEYEDLLITWLELVEEKDKIFYEENALYSWLKDVKLQEMKDNIEYQIRLLSIDNRNEGANVIEKELIDKLIETVNKRSELVDAMHEENLKRLKTIQLRQSALEKMGPLKDKEMENSSPIQSDSGKKKIQFWKKKSSLV